MLERYAPFIMNQFETQRQNFKPQKISVLFIAESPPRNGTFFYFQDSGLYSAMFEAYKILFKEIRKDNFLEDFKKRGFYLEDLCEDPINDLDDFSRIKARMDNIPVLVEKIKMHNPKVVVIIMKDIVPYIKEAIRLSEINPALIAEVPFPSRSQINIDKFVEAVCQALVKSIRLGVI